MADDYLPKKETDFMKWMQNFAAKLSRLRPVPYITDERIEELKTAIAEYDAAYKKHETLYREYKWARRNRSETRKALVRMVRMYVQWIKLDPKVSEKTKEELKLDVERSERKNGARELARPHLRLVPTRGQVAVHLSPTGFFDRKDWKPGRTIGANVYRKRVDEDEFKLLGLMMRPPFVDQITGPPAVYIYKARYVGMKDGELGPESEHEMVAAAGYMAA